MIAIVDYGAGNLASVARALAAIGAEPKVVSAPEEAGEADGIVLPGVGHFGAIAQLSAAWQQRLREDARAGRPLLGICLGMQWLFEGSEEAPGCAGLGVFPGVCHLLDRGSGYVSRTASANLQFCPTDTTVSLPAPCGKRTPTPSPRIKVPHVGWNRLEPLRPARALAGVPPGAFVYFTHSYAAPIGPECVAATTHGEPFAALVERDHVWGTQFHPEKSGDVGLQILRNFVRQV